LLQARLAPPPHSPPPPPPLAACHLQVELSFTEEAPGTTQLALRQSGIPEVDRFANEDVMATVERGWQGQVLTRIRQVRGGGVEVGG